ncbi:hypothetical protein BDN71DRAFT_1433449 [Pleurotus eryngii]|uniref:Uncharacterized protein n=1 Tax=Pleurotus eryngii TaxID=5323 RepID=A0A9P6DCV5_PLEER|nr:hypothetical protein BDN71DRAFT_1433449 [Pleurotus eryngii]
MNLAELESRPATPIRFWYDLDGLEATAPYAMSLVEAKACHMELTRRSKVETLTISVVPDESAKSKGKQCELPSSLSDYESDYDSARPVLHHGTSEAVSRELQAAMEMCDTTPQSVTASASNPAVQSLMTERFKELYTAYLFEISEFWRVDSLPENISAPANLLKLLKSTAKKIPFAIKQILRMWKRQHVVYWIQFRDKDQALRTKECLS